MVFTMMGVSNMDSRALQCGDGKGAIKHVSGAFHFETGDLLVLVLLKGEALHSCIPHVF